VMPRRHFMGDRTYKGLTYTLQLEAVEDCVFKAHARLLPSGPEVSFVDGTPRGPIRAWYDNGEISAIGETRPDNGTLTLRDERGRKRAQIDVRGRQVVTQAWDADGREERYEEAKLAKALAANRDLSFIMNIFAVGIGIQ